MADRVSRKALPHITYHNEAEKVIPGATTIPGQLDKPALAPAANRLGLAGINSTEHWKGLAWIGTCAHLMVSADMKGEKPDLKDFSEADIDAAENSYLSYLSWAKDHEIIPILIETPLVSEAWQYGGTVDFYGFIDGTLTVMDYKTGKGIYPEMIMQIIAYSVLLEEHGHKVEQGRILRIGRDEDEGYDDKIIILADCKPHWEAFLLLKELYPIMKVIKKKGA